VSTVDNIVRTGSISWYVVATDTKGATTKTAVKTITVTRCDTPASFAAGPYTPKKLYPTRQSPSRSRRTRRMLTA